MRRQHDVPLPVRDGWDAGSILEARNERKEPHAGCLPRSLRGITASCRRICPFLERTAVTLSSSPDVTALLRAWQLGDQQALERLAPIVYDELRRIARRHLRHERPDHPLQATALVHEAYLKLVDIRAMDWRDRAHFFAMASRLMRRVLVDAARAGRYQKRGGGAVPVTLSDALLPVVVRDHDLQALDDALETLARVDHRKSRVVELRYFGGLSLEETAAVLQVSSDTVTRDWKFARTWLLRELLRKGR